MWAHTPASHPLSQNQISIRLLVGLLSTTSVLGFHPALTNTTRKRKLICCAPVIILLAARLNYARYFVQKRHQRLTQRMAVTNVNSVNS